MASRPLTDETDSEEDECKYDDESFEKDSDTDAVGYYKGYKGDESDETDEIEERAKDNIMHARTMKMQRPFDESSSEDEDDVIFGKTIAQINTQNMDLNGVRRNPKATLIPSTPPIRLKHLMPDTMSVIQERTEPDQSSSSVERIRPKSMNNSDVDDNDDDYDDEGNNDNYSDCEREDDDDDDEREGEGEVEDNEEFDDSDGEQEEEQEDNSENESGNDDDDDEEQDQESEQEQGDDRQYSDEDEQDDNYNSDDTVCDNLDATHRSTAGADSDASTDDNEKVDDGEDDDDVVLPQMEHPLSPKKLPVKPLKKKFTGKCLRSAGGDEDDNERESEMILTPKMLKQSFDDEYCEGGPESAIQTGRDSLVSLNSCTPRTPNIVRETLKKYTSKWRDDMKHDDEETEEEEEEEEEQEGEQETKRSSQTTGPDTHTTYNYEEAYKATYGEVFKFGHLDNKKPKYPPKLNNIPRPKPRPRKSYSFTNPQVRDIERTNRILLKKILSQKPTYSMNLEQKNSKSSTSLPSAPRTTSAAVNRKKNQRQIDIDNQMLRRRIQAISMRKPKM